MGKKAKLTRFEDEDDEIDQVPVLKDEREKKEKKEKKEKNEKEGKQEKEESKGKTASSKGNASLAEVADADAEAGAEAEEKRKRKRKRAAAGPTPTAAEGESDGEAPTASKQAAPSSKKSGNKISGGSGEIVGQTALPPGAEVYSNNATIYIEGIPFEATEADVREFFKNCGTIKSLRLPTWQDTGRLRGYGHVEFASDAQATKARELDGSYLKKRYIKIDTPKVPKVLLGAASSSQQGKERPVGCKQVFVKNIPYDCTEEDVRDVFKVCGPIEDVRMARWGHTDQLKGFCYVSFKREDSADIAVKKTGQLAIRGRPVLVDFETGAPKMGFKHSSGGSKGAGGGGK
jgi:nucleolin